MDRGEARSTTVGLDTLRTALDLLKETEGALPPGEKKGAVAAALAEADKQIRIAEAQIAQGFGFALCQCTFPPTPMLHGGDYRTATE